MRSPQLHLRHQPRLALALFRLGEIQRFFPARGAETPFAACGEADGCAVWFVLAEFYGREGLGRGRGWMVVGKMEYGGWERAGGELGWSS